MAGDGGVTVAAGDGTHHGRGGRGVLAGLVLRGLDARLQVRRRVEVLALVPAAAALDVVHAHDDRVLAAVHHARLQRVGVAAVVLAARAVAPLELPTHLGSEVRGQRSEHVTPDRMSGV